MDTKVGRTGLIFDEPLIWERGGEGRCGCSIPVSDVPEALIDPRLTGGDIDFPEVSEGEVVRHFTRLSQWNYGVDSGMYPLGSCTMKYNPKTNERQAALPGFAYIHPLAPAPFAQGVLRMMRALECFLAEITGMDAVSLQPSAGAQGELTGIMLVRAWHRSRGDARTKIIIPDTAHGTNPASVALCGFKPVPVATGPRGVLEPDAVAAVMGPDVAGIMVTNPNTLGLFEENIVEIARIVHDGGGLVYCDGANLNAVMGIVRMGDIGVDVMHVNLHKTFSTPHGGGGPGSGPVCVKKHLEPFLPVPRIVENDGLLEWSYDRPGSIGKIHAFYGNVGVMVRAYSYIMSMGPECLKQASRLAVLNANYIKERLRDVLDLPYDRPCMHECVFSDARQHEYGVSTLDMAKRLIDYGFHPPTVYFPLIVKGAIMIEPTETESPETIDMFIDTMRAITDEAASNPGLLHDAPVNSAVRRLDETAAARNLDLTG